MNSSESPSQGPAENADPEPDTDPGSTPDPDTDPGLRAATVGRPPTDGDRSDGGRPDGRRSDEDPAGGDPTGGGPTVGPSFVRRLLGLVLVVLPLALAGLWAVVGPEPEPDQIDVVGGGPVQSALADASANASFTVAGAEQLRSGTTELADATGRLRDGAAELASGMEQLQAGTGQAGAGATDLADGVGRVVGAVRGVAVIQGQVSTAIEDALSRLRGDAPETVRAREALIGLRDQLAAQGLDQNTLSNLDRLETGADELARQLSSPGAPMRDGIYEATRGSRELATATSQLADASVTLRDGAASVADSAGRTRDAIGRTGRALAEEQGDVGLAVAAAADDTERRTSAGILGVAAAAVLGALMVQLVRRPGSSLAEQVLALVLLTAGLSAWALATADAPSVPASVAVVAVVGLVVVASSLLWRALTAVLGAWPGRIVAVILAAASAGAAWWVWVAGGAPSSVVTATSATTTGQATAALDAVLLTGPAVVAWTGAAVLVAVAVFSGFAVRIAGRPRTV